MLPIPLPLPRNDDHQSIRGRIYTPIEEAVELLHSRQSLGLFSDLDRDGFLEIPAILRRPRTAVIFRQIGTPNYEMHHVVSLAARHDLNLVIWEYHTDRFLARNACKHALGRMGFYSGLGRNGGRKMQYANIIDFNRCDGMPFSEVRTIWGQPLIEFHHELLRAEFPQLSAENFFDASAWFARHGGKASSYYKAFILLYIRHAILFETFVLAGSELEFTREVFLPALDDAHAAFGIKPLIVRSEVEREDDDHGLMYPAQLQNCLPQSLQPRTRNACIQAIPPALEPKIPAAGLL